MQENNDTKILKFAKNGSNTWTIMTHTVHSGDNVGQRPQGVIEGCSGPDICLLSYNRNRRDTFHEH